MAANGSDRTGDAAGTDLSAPSLSVPSLSTVLSGKCPELRLHLVEHDLLLDGISPQLAHVLMAALRGLRAAGSARCRLPFAG